MWVEGNIFADAERLTRNVTNGTPLAGNVTFQNNLMPFAWSGPGANNFSNHPAFKYVPQLSETTNFTSWKSAQVLRDWFSLRAGSPAIAAGPNGRDLGGVRDKAENGILPVVIHRSQHLIRQLPAQRLPLLVDVDVVSA